jgi:hypothetical protein
VRTPTLRSGAEPIATTVSVAVWHEIGCRVRNDRTATVYHTTPIEVVRPIRGTADAEVICRVCRELVPVRVVDVATARRRRICGDVLGWGQYILAPVLLCAVVMALASVGLRLGSGLPAVLAWLVVVLPVLLSVLGFTEWAQHRAGGVTILRAGDARHRIGSGSSPMVTLPAHATSSF